MKRALEILTLLPFNSLVDALYQSTEGGGLPMAVQLSVAGDVSFTVKRERPDTLISGDAESVKRVSY